MDNRATRLLVNRPLPGSALADRGYFLIDPAGRATVANILGGVTQKTLPFDTSYSAALAGGLTVFAVNGPNGDEPWVTDGTVGGTHQLAALAPGVKGLGYYPIPSRDPAIRSGYFNLTGSTPGDFSLLDPAHALFTAGTPSGAVRLWTTDGTAAGTRVLSDAVSPGGAGTALGDGRVLFQGQGKYPADNAGYELWITDGTAAGTRRVTDLAPGSTSSSPSEITAIGGGRAVFNASDGTSRRLYVTDGTAAGTLRIGDAGYTNGFTALGNGLTVYAAGDAAHGGEPWVTDGTAAGTHLLLDIVPGPTGSTIYAPDRGFGLLGTGRAVFFVDADPGTDIDRQLWVTDGTAAGTALVKDFGVYNDNDLLFSNPYVSLADGRVAFTVTVPGAGAGNGNEIWVTDGTAAGTQVLSGVSNDSRSAFLTPLSGAGLVDAPFYYGLYPDIAAAGVVSATHYDLSGWHEGRDPNAFFSTPGYLDFYKDVGAAAIDPLAHYDAYGWHEGRDPSAAFDTNLYLLFNPDVKAAGLDPLQHWLADGQVEGRKMSAVVDSGKIKDLFDPTFYGLSNSDVTAAGADLGTHFNTYGVVEGRNPDAFFDTKYYLAQNPDVAASGINPVAHYLNVGWTEGRDPSTHFSTTKYLAAYADVKAAGVNPLQHFLASGIIEGRSGFGDRI